MPSRNFLYSTTCFVAVVLVAAVFSKIFAVNIPQNNDQTTQPSETASNAEILDRVLPELKALFPDPEDWRRKSANVVFPKNKGFFFLFKNDDENADKPSVFENPTQLELNACTFVFLAADESLSLAERIRQSLIFEASDGVLLEFSAPIVNFSSLTTGVDYSTFEKGTMRGSVVIRSNMKSPTKDDDIRLETREVIFTEKQIRTGLEVTLAFTFGSNSGKGKGLTIDLDLPTRLVGSSTDAAKTSVDDDLSNALATSAKITSDDDWRRLFERVVEDGNLGGGFAIEQIELNQLDDYFHFYWNKNQTSSDAFSTKGDGAKTSKTSETQRVDIRCGRGVYFAPDLQAFSGWCVKFNQAVEAVVYQNGEKATQLNCDALYVYLQDLELANLAKIKPEIANDVLNNAPTGRLARLKPTIIRAQGAGPTRAICQVTSNDATLEADSIIYHVLQNKIEMKPAPPKDMESPKDTVRVSYGGDLKFFANSIELQLDENRQLQSLDAGENGLLEIVLRDDDNANVPNGFEANAQPNVGRKFSATWKNSLKITPDEKQIDALKMSTSGGVTFFLEGIGSFNANEANFWGKFETAKKDAKANAPNDLTKRFSKIIPLAASFSGDVQFKAARGIAKISDSVAVRFRTPKEIANENGPNGRPTPEGTANATTSEDGDFFSNASTLSGSADTTFEINGRKLDLWCLLQDAETNGGKPSVSVDHLTLNGDVSIVERSKLDGKESMRLAADATMIFAPGTKRARVQLVGSPAATFQMKDLTLIGGKVVVDCADNYFAIDGPGKLTLKHLKNAFGKNAEQNDVEDFFLNDDAEIVWSKAMTFDGTTLEFHARPNEEVLIAQPRQTISCSKALLTLARPISIFEIDALAPKKEGDATIQKELDVRQIECVGSRENPVQFNALAFGDDENSNGDSHYRGEFQRIAFNPSSGIFEASEGGSLWATVRDKKKNLRNFGDVFAAAATKNGQNRNAAQAPPNDDAPRWTRLHLKFSGTATGSVDERKISTEGGVQAVACQTTVPNAPLDVAARETFPKGAAYLTADEALLQFAEAPQKNGNPKNDQTSVEVQARRNVVFRCDEAIGLCDELHYASEKNVVVLSGHDGNKGMFFTQKYSGAPREGEISFARAFFYLDSQQFKVENLDANVE